MKSYRRIALGTIVLAGAAVALATLPARADSGSSDKVTPYQEEVHVGIAAGDDRGTADSSAIPLGQRLIIEYISAFARMPKGQAVWEVLFRPTAGGSAVNTDLLMTYQSTYRNNTYDGLVSSGPVRLYADPGTKVSVDVFLASPNGVTPADVWVKFSGRLVPCEPGQGCPLAK
jgi:hypothetical protein